ncbi:MAG TPA: DUF4124 domain-containing protein [Burkholderiaceae bacterium]|nr:DUF4124 domain-containing protein [Burkholderiaceae bacterium]
MNRTIVAICLAIAPLVATATIYKVRMPDGTILFTDSPPSGGKILEERESTPAPRQSGKTSPSPGVTAPRPSDRSSPQSTAPSATGGGPQNIDTAMAEINDAERELAVARRKLEAGREPLPGERLGTAKGGSRLSPEYEGRIALLEREVAAAEARVKRAYDARNALR